MSSNINPDVVVVGSDITLTCTLALNSAIMGSEKTLLMVDAQLSRDGTQLALTGLTVTGTTFTYTTAVNSFGRSDSGNYTCTATIRPRPSSTYLTGNEMLSTTINIRASEHSLARLLYFHLLIIAASPPPLNVRATQSSSSAPVEVSWSPPTDGANSVTGYRIYYGNGKNVFVSSVTVITAVSLKVDGNYIGQNVSVRSEADQLYSELINVSIVTGKYTYYRAESDIYVCDLNLLSLDNNEQCAATMDTSVPSCSWTSEVGIAVGVTIVVVCLVSIAITVIVVLCLWR